MERLSSIGVKATKTSLEKKHLGNGDCFAIIASSSRRLCCKWTARSAVEVNVDNERFTVVCSRCR